MGTGATFTNLEFDSGFTYCLPLLACVVGVALETQHRDDESLISKPRRIFVVVLKARQTKKVAQTFCAKQCKRKYQSITWKYELTFKQTTENSFLSDVENLAMFMFTEIT